MQIHNYLILIFLIIIPSIAAENTMNELTKGYGDYLYCSKNGNCNLNSLSVGNLTVWDQYLNVSVFNYNVTGDSVFNGNFNISGNITVVGTLNSSRGYFDNLTVDKNLNVTNGNIFLKSGSYLYWTSFDYISRYEISASNRFAITTIDNSLPFYGVNINDQLFCSNYGDGICRFGNGDVELNGFPKADLNVLSGSIFSEYDINGSFVFSDGDINATNKVASSLIEASNNISAYDRIKSDTIQSLWDYQEGYCSGAGASCEGQASEVDCLLEGCDWTDPIGVKHNLSITNFDALNISADTDVLVEANNIILDGTVSFNGLLRTDGLISTNPVIVYDGSWPSEPGCYYNTCIYNYDEYVYFGIFNKFGKDGGLLFGLNGNDSAIYSYQGGALTLNVGLTEGLNISSKANVEVFKNLTVGESLILDNILPQNKLIMDFGSGNYLNFTTTDSAGATVPAIKFEGGAGHGLGVIDSYFYIKDTTDYGNDGTIFMIPYVAHDTEAQYLSITTDGRESSFTTDKNQNMRFKIDSGAGATGDTFYLQTSSTLDPKLYFDSGYDGIIQWSEDEKVFNFSNAVAIKYDLYVGNELHGGWSYLQFHRTSMTASGYMGFGASANDADTGIVADCDGSIIGVSGSYDTTDASGLVWQIMAFKNNVNVFSCGSTSGAGAFNCTASQKRNIDTFKVGDNLGMYFNYTSGSKTINRLNTKLKIVCD